PSSPVSPYSSGVLLSGIGSRTAIRPSSASWRNPNATSCATTRPNSKSHLWRSFDAAPRQSHQAVERECVSQRPHQPLRLLERDSLPYQKWRSRHGSERSRRGLRKSGPLRTGVRSEAVGSGTQSVWPRLPPLPVPLQIEPPRYTLRKISRSDRGGSDRRPARALSSTTGPSL